MTTITVQKGDNLWKLARQQGLTNNRDIANYVNSVIAANPTMDSGKIKAGDSIFLPDQSSVLAKTLKPAVKKASPVTKPVAKADTDESVDKMLLEKDTPAPETKPAVVNMGTKFDDWAIGNSAKMFEVENGAMANVDKFAKEHSTPEEAQLRDNYVSSEQDRVEKAMSQVPEFRFAGEAGKPMTLNVYREGVLKLAQDSISNVKDLDGDAKTLNYEEFKQKELADLAKIPADKKDEERLKKEDEEFWQLMEETSTPEQLAKMHAEDPGRTPKPEETEASIKNAFETTDIDGDGKVTDKEKAVVAAYMDKITDGEFNGRMSLVGFNAVGAALGDPSKKAETKEKLATIYSQLFNAG